MTDLLKLKQQWKAEEERLVKRIREIINTSKEYSKDHRYRLVTPEQFEEAKSIIPVLNGGITEENSEFACKECKPKQPLIFFGNDSIFSSHMLISPPPFNTITFYLTLDISKEVVLREFKKFYDSALKLSGSEPEIFGSEKGRSLLDLIGLSFKWSKWEEQPYVTKQFIEKTRNLLELVGLSFRKREYNIDIVTGKRCYSDFGLGKYINTSSYNMCNICEEKGAVDKLKKGTLDDLASHLLELGVQSGEYQASIRVQKEKIW